MTSLLFRVISAHRCRSTHHHIAISALTLLKGENAQGWQDHLLVMHDDLLRGAKAPDAEFKDFKNHVLHIEEGEWGGARDAALEWYGKSVMALKAKKWADAAYALGVMSHYYADPIQPFHTGQTEEEGAIHRAVEWSIAKSRAEILRRIEAKGYPVVETGTGAGFVSDMVRAGAEKSHPHYQTLLDHYNIDAGVKVPEDGLDDTLLDVIAELVAYATSGLAAIYMRAFEEAAVAPPKSNLTINGFLATLDIPIRWITSKLDDANDRRIVEAMYKELTSTGKVIKNLPDDDKQIRKMHAQQVLRMPLKELDAQRMRKIGQKHIAPSGSTAPVTTLESKPRLQETKEKSDTSLPMPAAPISNTPMDIEAIAAMAQDVPAFVKPNKHAIREAAKDAKRLEKEQAAQQKADIIAQREADKKAEAQAKLDAIAKAKVDAEAEAKAAAQAKLDAIEAAKVQKETEARAKAETEMRAQAEARAQKEAAEKAAEQARAEKARIAEEARVQKLAEIEEKKRQRAQADLNESAEAAALLSVAHKKADQREAEKYFGARKPLQPVNTAPTPQEQEAETTTKPVFRVKTNGQHSQPEACHNTPTIEPKTAQNDTPAQRAPFETIDSSDNDIDDYNQSASRSRREPLSMASKIVDAPSIGAKTAARMNEVGIITVGDFVQSKAKDLSAKLNVGYMTQNALIDWQDQALLMIDMPTLRAHDVQILVGAGIRCVEDLAESSSRDLFQAATTFLKTKDGARIAQNSGPLDHEEIYDWIEEAQAAFA